MSFAYEYLYPCNKRINLVMKKISHALSKKKKKISHAFNIYIPTFILCGSHITVES
jgi:hypothetical protein